MFSKKQFVDTTFLKHTFQWANTFYLFFIPDLFYSSEETIKILTLRSLFTFFELYYQFKKGNTLKNKRRNTCILLLSKYFIIMNKTRFSEVV